MKLKINTILPAVLAILLPILSFLTNENITFAGSPTVYIIWAVSSFVLYNLWYLLWYLWDLRRKFNDWRFLLKIAACCVGIFIGLLIMRSNAELANYFKLTRPLLGVFVCLVIQYSIRVQENISRLQVEKERIQTEHYKAQLKVLHAKIDPHFLFNSLNTLRAMVRNRHGNAEDFILGLSGFYRQTLKYNENTSLPLSKELSILESYLFLMKNRNEEAVFVDINIDKSLYSLSLPTFALQIVAENCFKHNTMTSKMPLRIEISNTNDKYIVVKNNIQPKITAGESTGNGLDGLAKRYALMHTSNGVIVEQSSDHFNVKLKLIN